jgi:hypothetical protein
MQRAGTISSILCLLNCSYDNCKERELITMTRSRIFLLLSACMAAVSSHASKPNFILIMTDDQDLLMDSIDYQPAVQKHFRQEGTWFKKHFCTVALCCPSRVSFLTGKAAHNTNVTDVSAPYGGLKRREPARMFADQTQVAIHVSSRRASTTSTSLYGSKKLATIHITQAR